MHILIKKTPSLNFYMALLVLSFSFITPVTALESSAEKKWAGKWDQVQAPRENPEVYYYYQIKLNDDGFAWESVNREVPYGPNEEQKNGSAYFVDEFKATDHDNKLMFTLIESSDGAMSMTVKEIKQNTEGEKFYYIAPYYKAGFNCAKASTVIEKAICTNKRIALADREMNVQYISAKKNLNKAQAKALKTEQRSWIKQRNACTKNKKADISCLRLSYAHRLATLQKINNPALGDGNGINSSYLAGLKDTKTELKSNIPFLLALASEQEQVAVDLMNNKAQDFKYTVDQSEKGTELKGQYYYDSICWPADCSIDVSFSFTVNSQGKLKISKSQKSNLKQ